MELNKMQASRQQDQKESIHVSDLSTYFALPLHTDTTSGKSDSVTSATKISSVFRQQHDSGLDAFQRHQKLVYDYMTNYATPKNSLGTNRTEYTGKEIQGLTEADILKQHHKFLRSNQDDAESTWETRIAKKYYDKLFKEYCLAEMSLYKEGKIAMRWRSQKEVTCGKGQFECGNLKCASKEDLKSWEVNFAYMENREQKNALVKLRLCADCTYKLHYRKIKRQREEEKQAAKEHSKRVCKSSQDHKYSCSRTNDETNGLSQSDTSQIDENNRCIADEKIDDKSTDFVKGKPIAQKELIKQEATRVYNAPTHAKVDEASKSKKDESDEYFADLLL
ncbi:hypothetical protein O5D80_006033 [Batrachochytrium dendrobatidis]|nr:hypothetical protein O5D80_006033 [Batrachochytrium dendrobatidis]